MTPPDLITRLAQARPSARLDPAADPTADRNPELTTATRNPRRQADLALILATAQDARPHRLLPRTVRQQAGVGLAAAASIAAIATVIATGSLGSRATTPAPPTALKSQPGTGTPQAAALSASQILLLAARQVSTTTATTGRYWRERARYVSLQQVGPANGKYLVSSQERDDTWTARSAHATSWWISQNLGTKPTGPADVTAWQQAGSPTSWKVPAPKPGSRGWLIIEAAGGKPSSSPSNSGSMIFSLGNHNVSMADLQRLPADPARLKARLITNFRNGGGGGDLPSTQDAWLFRVASDLLEMPVRPGVRAAAYRLIAGLDGVRSLGRTVDVDGRVGNGVAIRMNNAAGLSEDRIIIEPSTGLPLAEEITYLKPTGSRAWLKPNQVWYAHVVDSIGWTNATPPKLPHS